MNHEDTKARSFLRGNQAENGGIPSEVERAAALVVDSAFAVHKNLGAGLLESVYETCFCHELQKRACNSNDRSFCQSYTVTALY